MALEETTMTMSTTYLLYLAISAAITIWVARTLHDRGRIFLVNCAKGNERLADSINDLLVVGFYLVNFGYVTLALRYGTKPTNVSESIEFLSTKIGLVLLILGAMHFFNIFIFTRMGQKRPPRRVEGDSPFASLANHT
jgi:H+/Cl- antiporter ClcA